MKRPSGDQTGFQTIPVTRRTAVPPFTDTLKSPKPVSSVADTAIHFESVDQARHPLARHRAEKVQRQMQAVPRHRHRARRPGPASLAGVQGVARRGVGPQADEQARERVDSRGHCMKTK